MNDTLTVETKTTENDGAEVRTVRVITNPYDVNWDVTDTNWVSIYATDDFVKLNFGATGGVKMTRKAAEKLLVELSSEVLSSEVAESVV